MTRDSDTHAQRGDVQQAPSLMGGAGRNAASPDPEGMTDEARKLNWLGKVIERAKAVANAGPRAMLNGSVRHTSAQLRRYRVIQTLETAPLAVEPHFYHPGVITDKDCILSGQGYTRAQVEQWNTRPSQPPVMDVERVWDALAVFQSADRTWLQIGKDDFCAEIAAMQSGEG